jgi:hypothetical protein
MDRSVFVERLMSPQLVVVGGIACQNPAQVSFAQDNTGRGSSSMPKARSILHRSGGHRNNVRYVVPLVRRAGNNFPRRSDRRPGLELGLARDNAHSFFVSFESLSARGGRFSMATALIEGKRRGRSRALCTHHCLWAILHGFTRSCMRCKPSHPSPSAGQFRIPFNWLASSELRRIFCSDEGAGADSSAV